MTDQSKTECKDIGQGRKQCTVTFSPEEIAPAEAKALEHLGKNVKLDGFREGKVPTDLLREKVDASALLEEIIRELLPATFDRLVQEHEIVPIIPPNVEAVSQDPLTLEITFVERPQVKVKGIDKIKIPTEEVKLDDKDVDRMIDYILQQHRATKVVLRAAEDGDQVTMDFWGEGEDGQEIPDIRSVDYQVVLGSKTLLPGFEEALIGLETGTETSFQLTFPDKYHAEYLRNTPVTFHVTIKQIDSVDLPTLDDDFAKSQLGAASAQEFRDNIKTSMVKQEEDVNAKRREQLLLDKIRDAVQVDLPDELINDELQQLKQDFLEDLERQGATLEQWMQQTGRKAEDLAEDMKKNAASRITIRLGLHHIIEEKEIQVSDEELQEAIEVMLAPLAGEEREQIEASYKPGHNAYEQLRWQKRVEKLMTEMLGR